MNIPSPALAPKRFQAEANPAEGPLHVLIGTDERYLPGAVVTAASIVAAARSGTPFVFHVMDFGIDPGSRVAFSEFIGRFPSCGIVFHSVDLDVFTAMDVPTFGALRSVAPYGRLLAPEFVDASRVIYVDTDFFVRKDFVEAWNLPLEGIGIAACLNTSRLGCADRDTLAWDCPFTDDASLLSLPYYNSGFMIVNLDWWREHDITRKAFRLLAGKPPIRSHDQTLINWLCAGATLTLDRSWNSTPWWTRPLDSGSNLHFSSDFKPWLERLHLPAERIWLDFYRKKVRPYWDPARRTMKPVHGFFRFLRHYGLPAMFPSAYCALRKRFRDDPVFRRESDAKMLKAIQKLLWFGPDPETKKTLLDWRRKNR